MNILFLWDSDYPWDIRVEKICNTLIENGHEVHLVCRNKSRKSTEEIYQGISIHRIPCLPKYLGKLNDTYTFPIFFSPNVTVASPWVFIIGTEQTRSTSDTAL